MNEFLLDLLKQANDAFSAGRIKEVLRLAVEAADYCEERSLDLPVVFPILIENSYICDGQDVLQTQIS